MNNKTRWNLAWRPFLMLLLRLSSLAAELQATSNSVESSIEDQQSLLLRQPSFTLPRKKRSELEAENSSNFEEDDKNATGKFNNFTGPTELQIAQARKLILQEGKNGDTSPSNLQEMDLDALPLTSSSSFSFRLTNSSFLEALSDSGVFNSFSKLRQVVDDEVIKRNVDNFDADFGSNKSTLTNETDSQTSASDLIEKDKRLLAEMISKKTGFAFRHAEKGMPIKEGKPVHEDGSQNLEQHIQAPPPLCPPGSGVCRSLRERLLDDLVSSYSDPFTARIRYRLKRKPSVYTTRKPNIRNDIGIPDIYETEVTVMPHEALNLPDASSSKEALTHDPAVAAPDHSDLPVVSPVRPLLSLDALKHRARERNELNNSLKTRNKEASKTRSKNRARENQAAMRRYLARRGYGHPRMRTRTHLDYRRPVAFKFRRTNNFREQHKNKLKYDGGVPAGNLPSRLSQELQGVETPPSSSRPSGVLPQLITRRRKKEPRIKKPTILQSENNEAYSKPGEGKKHVEDSYEQQNLGSRYSHASPHAPTKTSVLQKNETQDYDSDINHETKNKYQVPNPPQNSGISSSHMFSSKSAAVPGWLMDLKESQLTLTPLPHDQSQRKSSPNQSAVTSPMPADYALKASNPSALPPTYATASPKRDLSREEKLTKADISEEQHRKSVSSYSSSSTPDHFQIINPRQKSTYGTLSPPPPNIRAPLESKLLPSRKPDMKTDQTSLFPHYPVIPSPDKTSGSKYSVKVTTPSGIYVTPVDVSSPPYGGQSRPVYAPPTSPKSTYATVDDLSYQTVKPHLNLNPHPYKAHISAVDLKDHNRNVSSYPIVTHLTPVRHEFLEHKASRTSTTSHRIVVTPKSYQATVTPKYPPNSDIAYDSKHSPKGYASSTPMVPTTFKPSHPRSDLTQLQKASMSSSEKALVKLPVSTPTSSQLNPAASQPTPHKESSNKKPSPEISLVPYILEDYVTGHDYYDDYYDFYNNDYSYYDDLYNYDYLLDALGVAEARPLLPFHVLPETFPKGQLQDFGYIAGVPGRAGRDYPVLGYIPNTSFGCGLVAEYPGYYADMDAGCQVFHVCHHDGTQDSYLCPNGTIFNQKYFVCDWWYNFNCEDAPFFYPVNAALSYAGLTMINDQQTYRAESPFLLRGTRRAQNTRPTKRRHLHRKSSAQEARPNFRGHHALVSAQQKVVLPPRRRASPALRHAPASSFRLRASVFPYITRAPNGTFSLFGNARSRPSNMPVNSWASAAHDVIEI